MNLSSFPFPARVMYNLDEEESQGGIAINLLPLLASDVQNKGEQQSQTKKAHKSVNKIFSQWCISLTVVIFKTSVYCAIYIILCGGRRVSPLCLSPFFRLLRVCEEKQHQGDLEEIDALLGEEVEVTHFSWTPVYSHFCGCKLICTCVCICWDIGCPLILTDMDIVEKMESLSKAEREFLCALIFHTINWFREVTAS